MSAEFNCEAVDMANLTITAVNEHVLGKVDVYQPIMQMIADEAVKGLDEIYLSESVMKATDNNKFVKYLKLIGYNVDHDNRMLDIKVSWNIYS